MTGSCLLNPRAVPPTTCFAVAFSSNVKRPAVVTGKRVDFERREIDFSNRSECGATLLVTLKRYNYGFGP